MGTLVYKYLTPDGVKNAPQSAHVEVLVDLCLCQRAWRLLDLCWASSFYDWICDGHSLPEICHGHGAKSRPSADILLVGIEAKTNGTLSM